MIFKTPKSLKGFKTERDYLKSVFYRNRKEIVDVFGKERPMEKFIKNIEAQKIVGDLTTKQALSKLAKSEAFTPVEDRFVDNVMKALKNFDKKKLFAQLRRDEKGRFAAFDRNKLVWDKDTHMYIYDDKITIDITNSPQDIIIGTVA